MTKSQPNLAHVVSIAESQSNYISYLSEEPKLGGQN
jgi:hypothetical protein